MVIWASSPVSTFRLVVGLWGPGAQFDFDFDACHSWSCPRLPASHRQFSISHLAFSIIHTGRK